MVISEHMISSPSPPSLFDSFNGSDSIKPQHGMDFLLFQSPSDVLAPHPDLFESELDSDLAAYGESQFELFTVDSDDAFSYLRSDTPTCGPPSVITASSESAYDTRSSRSGSYLNYPHSPYSASNYSFPINLEMEFQRIRVDAGSDYAPQRSAITVLDGTADATSFGTLPPTPPRSPPAPISNKGYPARNSYSDYSPSRRSDYYSHFGYGHTTLDDPTISPTHISTPLPILSSIPSLHSEEYKGDPRKKYQCKACPRAFARAFNLKTHMATHDPNRPKPHICPHRACGRSFSRKHDLGRHLISIHRDESVCSSRSATSTKSIGVDRAVRSRCDNCGKDWFGRNTTCDCHDIK